MSDKFISDVSTALSAALDSVVTHAETKVMLHRFIAKTYQGSCSIHDVERDYPVKDVVGWLCDVYRAQKNTPAATAAPRGGVLVLPPLKKEGVFVPPPKEECGAKDTLPYPERSPRVIDWVPTKVGGCSSDEESSPTGSSSDDSTSLLGGSGNTMGALPGERASLLSDNMVCDYMVNGLNPHDRADGVESSLICLRVDAAQQFVAVENPGRIKELEEKVTQLIQEALDSAKKFDELIETKDATVKEQAKVIKELEEKVTELLSRDFERTAQFDSLIEGMRKENNRLNKEVKEKDCTIKRIGDQYAQQAEHIDKLQKEIECLREAAPAAALAAKVDDAPGTAGVPPPPPPPYQKPQAATAAVVHTNANANVPPPPPHQEVRGRGSGMVGLLNQIKEGKELKKVEQVEKEAKVADPGLAEVFVSTPAMEILARRRRAVDGSDDEDGADEWEDDVQKTPPPPPPQPKPASGLPVANDVAGMLGKGAMDAAKAVFNLASAVAGAKAPSGTAGGVQTRAMTSAQARAGAAAVAPVLAIEPLSAVQEGVEQKLAKDGDWVQEKEEVTSHCLGLRCPTLTGAMNQGKDPYTWKVVNPDEVGRCGHCNRKLMKSALEK